MAADGLLLAEETQISGLVLVLRLLEKEVDTGQRGRVVMVGKLLDSGTILEGPLHRHNAYKSRCVVGLWPSFVKG